MIECKFFRILLAFKTKLLYKNVKKENAKALLLFSTSNEQNRIFEKCIVAKTHEIPCLELHFSKVRHRKKKKRTTHTRGKDQTISLVYFEPPLIRNSIALHDNKLIAFGRLQHDALLAVPARDPESNELFLLTQSYATIINSHAPSTSPRRRADRSFISRPLSSFTFEVSKFNSVFYLRIIFEVTWPNTRLLRENCWNNMSNWCLLCNV